MPLTLVTYDWLPEFPRGFVRDMRVRWILEELGRPYRVDTVPAFPKSAEHCRMQPFGQVPILHDGKLTLFESGAILLYLANDTPLLPDVRRAEITQWMFAALNTIEPASGHWLIMKLAERMPEFFGPAADAGVIDHARQGMDTRLAALEPAVAEKDWLTDSFSVADIAMIETLRVLDAEDVLTDHPALRAYIRRGTSRPAFVRAMEDHMAHWLAADEERAGAA